MKTKTFICLTPEKISKRIMDATNRVILASAGINDDIASALIHFADRCGPENVTLITDIDEDVYRLGYGAFEGIKELKEKGFRIRKHPGLRIGVLVCDKNGWIFSIPPLLVEGTRADDSEPNAVQVEPQQAEAFVAKMMPMEPDDPTIGEKDGDENLEDDPSDGGDDHNGDHPDKPDSKIAEPEDFSSRPNESAPEVEKEEATDQEIDETDDGPEIGKEDATDQEIEETDDGLKDNPPQEFDLARKVRVFNAKIQFVELKLQGTQIQRHTVSLPKHILVSVDDKETQERINAAFKLIQQDNKLSGVEIKNRVDTMRTKFLRSLGEFGNAILRTNRPEFDLDLEKTKCEVEKFKESVKANLEEELEKSMASLVDALVNNVTENPPANLQAQIGPKKPTEAQARSYLTGELKKVFPEPDKLIKEMTLKCIFKDVTYATLNELNFQKAIKKAFDLVDWEKPFEEFDAAREKQSEPSPNPPSE